MKRNSLWIVGVPKDKKAKGPESLLKEIMAEFSKSGERMDSKVHEVYRSPKKPQQFQKLRREKLSK